MDHQETLRLDRVRIAHRIHDLLLLELGEDMDVSLMLGPPEYARAVLSLCRSCGSAELTGLVEQFLRASQMALRARSAQPLRDPGPDLGPASDWAPHLPPLGLPDSWGEASGGIPR